MKKIPINDKSKKDLILSVSAKVFAQQGFYNSKISTIAKRCGIGTGTVYLYFENKDQILKELMVQIWTILANEVEEISQNNNLDEKEKLFECSKQIILLANNRKEIAKIVLQEFAFWNDPNYENLTYSTNRFKTILKSIISDGIEHKVFHPQLIPECAVHFLIGGVWHLIEYVVQSDDYNINHILDQTKLLVSHSFSFS
jgi:AcrR family transcriptional regulator